MLTSQQSNSIGIDPDIVSELSHYSIQDQKFFLQNIWGSLSQPGDGYKLAEIEYLMRGSKISELLFNQNIDLGSSESREIQAKIRSILIASLFADTQDTTAVAFYDIIIHCTLKATQKSTDFILSDQDGIRNRDDFTEQHQLITLDCGTNSSPIHFLQQLDDILRPYDYLYHPDFGLRDQGVDSLKVEQIALTNAI